MPTKVKGAELSHNYWLHPQLPPGRMLYFKVIHIRNKNAFCLLGDRVEEITLLKNCVLYARYFAPTVIHI